jgi:hypothetical protein
MELITAVCSRRAYYALSNICKDYSLQKTSIMCSTQLYLKSLARENDLAYFGDLSRRGKKVFKRWHEAEPETHRHRKSRLKDIDKDPML